MAVRRDENIAKTDGTDSCHICNFFCERETGTKPLKKYENRYTKNRYEVNTTWT
jgi:hypothetical protein